MPRSPRPTLARLALLAAPFAAGPAVAADLPFMPAFPAIHGAPAIGGGGFRVATVPARPAPQHYDIYGYPLLAGVPDPLAVGGGCPPAMQPNYDPDGNLAGYAPIAMCR